MEISRLVLSAEIWIALRPNVLFGYPKPRDGPIPRRNPQSKGGKEKKCRNGEKVKGEVIRFAFPVTNENELGDGAIPESQVNVAARQVNLSDVLGESDWGGKGEIGPKNVLSL